MLYTIYRIPAHSAQGYHAAANFIIFPSLWPESGYGSDFPIHSESGSKLPIQSGLAEQATLKFSSVAAGGRSGDCPGKGLASIVRGSLLFFFINFMLKGMNPTLIEM